MSCSSSWFEYCSRCTAQEYKLWELLFGVKEEMTCYTHRYDAVQVSTRRLFKDKFGRNKQKTTDLFTDSSRLLILKLTRSRSFSPDLI